VPSVRQVTHNFLERQGLTTIFGNPGSNELPFLADLPGSFRYVLGLREGAVVGMADGYAQASGRPVLVNLHAASGSGNAMGALTNAAASRTPLVIVAGQQVRPAIGPEANLTSVDAAALMRPLVCWAAEPACAQDVPRALAQAVFEAKLQRRPAYLSVPYDDWAAEAGENSLALLDRQVERAAVPSPEQGRRLAERLGAPVWAAPSLFRLPFPNRHPLFRGVLPAGIEPISQAFRGHDLVLVLGAPVFRYHEHLPGRYLPEGTRLIQVTDDASAVARAPMGEALLADLGAVIDLLVGTLDAPAESAGKYRPAPGEQTGRGPLLHPEEVFAALRDEQPSDTAYVVESTSTNSSWWRQMDLRWFAGLLGVPNAPGLDIPGLDFTRIAEGYGVPAQHVEDAEELRAVLAKCPTGPRLVQVDTILTTPS
jgi:benzoylformate decarboxylase